MLGLEYDNSGAVFNILMQSRRVVFPTNLIKGRISLHLYVLQSTIFSVPTTVAGGIPVCKVSQDFLKCFFLPSFLLLFQIQAYRPMKGN